MNKTVALDKPHQSPLSRREHHSPKFSNNRRIPEKKLINSL